MSKYEGWAVRLSNGKFANDSEGAVGPLLFVTRREARYWQSVNQIGVVVRVVVTVREAK